MKMEPHKMLQLLHSGVAAFRRGPIDRKEKCFPKKQLSRFID